MKRKKEKFKGKIIKKMVEEVINDLLIYDDKRGLTSILWHVSIKDLIAHLPEDIYKEWEMKWYYLKKSK